MKRIAMAAATALFASAGVVGCGGGDNSGDASSPAKKAPAKLEPANITLWVGFTDRELGVFKNAVKDFEALHPGVKVRVVGGISDDKIIAASRGGKAPDVAQSFTADNSGAFCGSGAWVDLKPYLERDKISDTIFPPAPRSYTQFKGTRCALPMLADAQGLYYNEDLFKKAGLSGPPKTISQLTEYAKKLTVKNPDGSLKVVGFNPVMNWYENTPAGFGPMFGAKWVDDSGKSSLVHRSGLAEAAEVAEGPDRLVRLRQARQVPGRPGRRVLGAERVREGQGRDEHGR